MNNNEGNNKLDWMYKTANSLVDREEYLLGRSVDKTLEQLNAEEKEKKLGLVPPKNHVEHECIPPSIREFNKIVQAEQVDISAKLQEDPLVAIKKREEEARRQFLQNPVQLKKLQEALKAQELKKKKEKHKKSKNDSDSEIDRKIAKKLKYLKGDLVGAAVSKKKKKKSNDHVLDTILMHKFNHLKDRLSQEDLNDILAGKVSDSDEEDVKHVEKHKKFGSSDEDNRHKQSKSKSIEKGRSNFSREKNSKKISNKRRKNESNSSSSSDSDDSSSEDELRSKKKYQEKSTKLKYKRQNDLNKNKSQRTRREDDENSESRVKRKSRQKSLDKQKVKGEHSSESRIHNDDNRDKMQRKEATPDLELENKILQKLRMLRDSSKSRRTGSSSDSDSSDSEQTSIHKTESDSDEKTSKPKTFGLVKADGTKIALNKKSYEEKKNDKPYKAVTASKPERKNVKKLTEEEKEKMRREMMKNAETRDKERSENLKKYRDEDKREEKSASHFDEDFAHKQLLRSTKEATVESRIKSNLNNIQRSSRHMDTHFSRR